MVHIALYTFRLYHRYHSMEQFSRQHREPDVCEVVLWRADRDDGHDSGRGNLSTAFSASRPHVEIVNGYSLMVSVSVSCRNAGVVVGLPVAAARGKELIRADLGDENNLEAFFH